MSEPPIYDGVQREVDDLKAEIEALTKTKVDLWAALERQKIEIARLNEWIGLHRGDTLSLDIEVNTMRSHWLDAEALWQSAEKTIVNLTDVVLDITRQRDEAEASLLEYAKDITVLRAVIRGAAREQVEAVRGSQDVPGFDACVEAEIDNLIAAVREVTA